MKNRNKPYPFNETKLEPDGVTFWSVLDQRLVIHPWPGSLNIFATKKDAIAYAKQYHDGKYKEFTNRHPDMADKIVKLHIRVTK